MRSVIAILLVFCLNNCFSQTLPADLESIKLEEKADYKAAEATTTQTANYFLSVPYVKKDQTRVDAFKFLFKWMSGTPDYSFPIDKAVMDMVKGNEELLPYYMACMAKYGTENPQNAKDEKVLKLNAAKLLLAYCEDEKNNMKMSKKLKKWSEANKKGELEKEL